MSSPVDDALDQLYQLALPSGEALEAYEAVRSALESDDHARGFRDGVREERQRNAVEVQRLREERDAAEKYRQGEKRRREAAEAEVRRLRELVEQREAEARIYAEEGDMRVQRLTEGLRFYADPATYEESNEPHPTQFATGIVPIHADKGSRARALLSDSPTDGANTEGGEA